MQLNELNYLNDYLKLQRPNNTWNHSGKANAFNVPIHSDFTLSNFLLDRTKILICFRVLTPNAELSASARSPVEPQGGCVRGQTVAPRIAQMWGGGVGVEREGGGGVSILHFNHCCPKPDRCGSTTTGLIAGFKVLQNILNNYLSSLMLL